MITKLHELPPDHHLRNTAIQHIDVRIKCRHSGTTRDPRTWRIKKLESENDALRADLLLWEEKGVK